MNFKQQYFNIWGKAYSLHKQFVGMAGTDEAWSNLIETSEKIMKEHEKEPQADFMRSLLLAVLAEIERNCKSRGKGGASDGTHGKLEQICEGDIGKAAGQA